MHDLEGVWVVNDELEWIFACINHGMVGYESGMVMRLVEIRYSWMKYDELVWVWSETWERLVTKVDIIYVHAW